MNQRLANASLPTKTAYVNKIPASGWLNVLERKSNALLPLLEYTKLQILESNHGRTFFTVADGAMKGRIAGKKNLV